jgi:hypothetical protein
MAVAKVKAAMGLVLLTGVLAGGAGLAAFQARPVTTSVLVEDAGKATAPSAEHQAEPPLPAAFAGRTGAAKRERLKGGSSPQAEAAVAAGLVWLVTQQEADGHWSPPPDPPASVWGWLVNTSLSLLTLEVYYRQLPLDRGDPAGKQEP